MPDTTINAVYAELIGSLKDLRSGKIDARTAEAMYKGANAIANLMSAEANMIKTAGMLAGSGFVPEATDPFEKEIPQYALEGMRDCSFCHGESTVAPDAPSSNGLVACDFCMKQDSTIHFRRQLALQGNKLQKTEVVTKLINVRLTEAHKEILYYLKGQDGQATIGADFGESKTKTIDRLVRLEKITLIECVQRPVSRVDFPENQRHKITSEQLHCGIWKLTNAGMKAAA